MSPRRSFEVNQNRNPLLVSDTGKIQAVLTASSGAGRIAPWCRVASRRGAVQLNKRCVLNALMKNLQPNARVLSICVAGKMLAEFA